VAAQLLVQMEGGGGGGAVILCLPRQLIFPLHPYFFLLDSQSSVHLVNDQCPLVTSVGAHIDNKVLEMHSNGGTSNTNLVTQLRSLECWYNDNSLANILSLALIVDKFHVTIHHGEPHEMRVWYSKSNFISFLRTGHNLFSFNSRTDCQLNR
jgi:hypothetical protein